MQASQHQWREYGWNGQRFTQTGGPAKFAANPKVTSLPLTIDPFTMTKQADGSWAGTVKVTIRNAAQFPTPGAIRFAAGGERLQVASITGCDVTPDNPGECRIPVLAKGASRTVTVQLTAPAGDLSAVCYLTARATDGTSDGDYPATPGDKSYVELPVRGA
jgi:hypothetical protein